MLLLLVFLLLQNLANHTPILQGCGNFDLYSEINGPRREIRPRFSDRYGYLLDNGTFDYTGPGKRIFFPQHFHVQALHEQFPNSTWILNTRPVQDWVRSVIKWGDNLGWQFANEYYMQRVIDTLPSNHDELITFLETMYLEHHAMIRDFVQRHPSHNLVEINITDDSAGTILAQAFGLDAQAWSQINQNRKGQFKSSWRPASYFYYYNHAQSYFWDLDFLESNAFILLSMILGASLGYLGAMFWNGELSFSSLFFSRRSQLPEL